MANPVKVECPADVWTLVAASVTTGLVHVLLLSPNRYRSTYRVAGGAAPADDTEAIPFCNQLEISSVNAIDVYVKADGKAGRVRVDL